MSNRVMRAVDNWWWRRASARRLDRHPIYLCSLIGVLLPAASIFWYGPNPTSGVAALSELTQVMLCGCITLGAALALVASAAPSHRVTWAYRMAFSATPAIVAGLGVYGWVTLATADTPSSALGGMLAPMLALGFAGKSLSFWLESRRIEHNTGALLQVAINHQNNNDEP
jgi:hypothetical protein